MQLRVKHASSADGNTDDDDDNRPCDPAKGNQVLHRLRKRLTYANAMSTLAVFVALGGSSYAAFTINGSTIKNRSIAGKKLRHNTLTGVQIKESQLGRVPRAKRADSLGGLTAADLKIKCPDD